jgi:chromosome segregation ATPase
MGNDCEQSDTNGGTSVDKQARAEQEIKQLESQLAEQRQVLAEAENRSRELDATWRALCLRADVEGEKCQCQPEIRQCEYERWQTEQQVERLKVSIGELEARLGSPGL